MVIDQLGGIPWSGQSAERGIDWSRFDYFVYCIEPGKLQTLIEEQLAHKERILPEILPKLVDFNNSISEETIPTSCLGNGNRGAIRLFHLNAVPFNLHCPVPVKAFFICG